MGIKHTDVYSAVYLYDAANDQVMALVVKREEISLRIADTDLAEG